MLKKKVAVKVFLQDMADIDNLSIPELLERSKQARHLLHAYKYVNTDMSGYIPPVNQVKTLALPCSALVCIRDLNSAN